MRSRRQTHWFTALTALAGVASASVVVAHALHSALAVARTDDARREVERAQRAAPVVAYTAAVPRQVGEQILARDIFRAQRSAPPRETANELSPAAFAPAAASAAKRPTSRCAGGLRLVGSVVNTARPERSLAAVSQDGKTHLMVPGRRLNDLTLATVHRTEAYLRTRAGTQCWISFAAPAPRPVAASVAAAAKRESAVQAPKNGKRTFEQFYSPEELEQGVRPLGRQGYAVSRDIVLLALTDPGKAAAGAHFRAVKGSESGAGMEVRKVREGSLLARIGLKSGDVVRSLSGADLTTATGLLAGLRKLRQDDSVTMVVVRDGVERSVQYALD